LVTASIPFVPWKPDPIRAYFVRLAFSNLASIFLLHSFFSDLIIPKCIASSFVVISLPSRYHLLILYDLPSITELLANLPLQISWKKLVRKEVEKLWLKRLQNDATAKTTLKYLAIKHLEIGTSYPLWKRKSKTSIAVKKSIIKARIITGTLFLQKDKRMIFLIFELSLASMEYSRLNFLLRSSVSIHVGITPTSRYIAAVAILWR
jgi:hypothetical protein